ncbi:MAG: hypothetical protein LBL87_00370, partial [Ruminococcus sp.]|nr:hypothetical protein [Ruminococcus sp.]
MATITKDIADAQSRVRARMQFQRELIEESNRLLSEKQSIPFHFGEANSDAVKTEISKATGIPFEPEQHMKAPPPQSSKPEAATETIKTERHAETAQALSPQRQTTLTEFEVIPDSEKVIAREGAQQPRKMHAGPRMFNFGFSFT